ncbi:hypothetical protein OH492_03420 [Vibrio chagasii]|nr:hypothetical protein [Vibrio chagasii]
MPAIYAMVEMSIDAVLAVSDTPLLKSYNVRLIGEQYISSSSDFIFDVKILVDA